MTDLYTKIVLTVIAVALSINALQGFQVVKPAFAASNAVHKIAICEADGTVCARMTRSGFLKVLNAN